MNWWLDVRHAVRLFARHPGSTALLLLTLALTIGANTAIFSVVDATLFRPLPYPEPDRLVQVVTRYSGEGASGLQSSLDGAAWQAIRDHRTSSNSAVYSGWVKGVNFATGDRAIFVRQERVGAGFFHVLGVLPLVGREFTPEEDRQGGAPVVVLGYALWQSVFNGRPDVIGRRVTLKGEPHTIVGVMPPGFTTPTPPANLWTPLKPSLTGEGDGSQLRRRRPAAPGHRRVANQELGRHRTGRPRAAHAGVAAGSASPRSRRARRYACASRCSSSGPPSASSC